MIDEIKNIKRDNCNKSENRMESKPASKLPVVLLKKLSIGKKVRFSFIFKFKIF